MTEDFGYVLKNSQGHYFCGMNKVDIQLRKALIYHSLLYANRTKDSINSNSKNLWYDISGDFEIVKVRVCEIDE
jgi:hypothetical protein